LFHELVYKRVSETIKESEDTDAILDKAEDDDGEEGVQHD
jgi:hypothetical protein